MATPQLLMTYCSKPLGIRTLQAPPPSCCEISSTCTVRSSKQLVWGGRILIRTNDHSREIRRERLTRAYTPVPMVIEQSERGERAYDIFSRLLKDRIICVNGPIADEIAHVVIGQLLFLEGDNPNEPIYMYVNSPGGSVTAGLAIYDTMQYIRSPVSTICMGQAASMASLLLAAGAKGERRALPNSTIMIHQPLGGYQGPAINMNIYTKQMIRVWDTMNDLYVKHTGQPLDIIQKNMDRDFFMTPEEAKEFGVIDEVIKQRPAALAVDVVRVGDEGKDKGSTSSQG